MCDFQSTSSTGLKTQISRKHTNYSGEIADLKCEISDKQFKTEKELKNHIISW